MASTTLTFTSPGSKSANPTQVDEVLVYFAASQFTNGESILRGATTNCTVTPAQVSNSNANFTITFSATGAYSANFSGDQGSYTVSGTVSVGPDPYISVIGNQTIAVDYNGDVSVSIANGATNTEYRLRHTTAVEGVGTSGTVASRVGDGSITIPGRSAAGASLLPNTGLSATYSVSCRLSGSSDSYITCYDSPSLPANVIEFTITRSNFVAPVISSISQSGSGETLTTSINTSPAGSGGTLEYAQSTSTTLPAVENFSGINSFSQNRNTTRYYFAARIYNHPDTGELIGAFDSEALTINFVAPDPCNSIGNFSIGGDETTFSISISGGSSPTVYEVRSGSYTGTIEGSRVGNGTLNVSDAPAQNSNKTYYLTAFVPTANGGSGTRINIDTFVVSRDPSTPGTPTSITFEDAENASATANITVTSNGGTGDGEVAQAASGWETSPYVFGATRGTLYTYYARNNNAGVVSGTISAGYRADYLSPDLSISSIANQTIPFADTSFVITIANGNANTDYNVEFGGTVLATGNGNANITVTSGLPAGGTTRTYTVTAYRTTGTGGDATDVQSTQQSFSITKTAGVSVPNAFDSDLGGDATDVVISSGSYFSSTATISGLETSAALTFSGAGAYSKNGGSYTTAAGSVINGDTVRIRVPAAATYSTTSTGTLTIGGVVGDFAVITEADPNVGGGVVGDGGAGTYGLRTFDSSGNVTLDVSDRVGTFGQSVSTSMSIGETTKNITLSRSGSVAIRLDPPQTVISGGVPLTNNLIGVSVSGTTLTLTRETATAAQNCSVLVVFDG